MNEKFPSNAEKVHVWGDHGELAQPAVNSADQEEIDYHIKAANDPSSLPPGIIIRDVTRTKGGVREAIVTDDAVLAKLLGDAELELDQKISESVVADPTIDRDPLKPSAEQLQAVKEIYRGETDENLGRVAIPVKGGRFAQPGVPEYGNTLNSKPAPKPEPINIRPAIVNGVGGADAVNGPREAVGWEKPAPVRTAKPEKPAEPGFFKKLFGGK